VKGPACSIVQLLRLASCLRPALGN
jgi:hypothetical protein